MSRCAPVTVIAQIVQKPDTSENRTGRPRKLTSTMIARILVLASEQPQPRWTVRRIAAELGVSASSVQAVLKPKARATQ